jgi:hypothetical protein
VVAFVSACAAPPPKSPADGLPSYGAEDANLLDDSFSGHLFETAFVPGVAGDDPHFDERVARAQCIWLVKVATVSREGSLNESRRYSLSFRPLESLAGPLPTEPVSLTISAKDPAFHWLDRVGGAWVGKEVWLMTRNYRESPSDRGEQAENSATDSASSLDSEVVMHFHGEPNNPEIRARMGRIRQALGQ